MKVKADVLIKHIEKASICGAINEMVLDDKLKFAVTDDARAVLSICNSSLGESTFGIVGVYDLELLIKTIRYSSEAIFNVDEELNIDVIENRMVFKKGDNEFKFLLSNPKVISSTIESPADTLAKLRSEEGIQIVLDKKDIDSVLKAITLIVPEIITIVVKDKKVLCLIGKDTEHNTNIKMGSFTTEANFVLKFKPDLFSKVLTTIADCDDVKLELRSEFPAILVDKDYTLVIAPVQE